MSLMYWSSGAIQLEFLIGLEITDLTGLQNIKPYRTSCLSISSYRGVFMWILGNNMGPHIYKTNSMQLNGHPAPLCMFASLNP